MMPEDVRKAVEAMDMRFTSSNSIQVERASIRDHEWAAIKAYLLAREAEVGRLTAIAEGIVPYQVRLGEAATKLARANALLRFLLDRFGNHMDESDKQAITAHLSENSRG